MKIDIDYYSDFENDHNLDKYNQFLKNYENKVMQIVRLSIEKHNITHGNFYLGLGIVGKQQIKNINKETRNIDKVTDVLSFPMQTLEELKKLQLKTSSNVEQVPLGDIVICLEKVEEQAIEYETGIERELLYMITHGMCHLMGYDHEDLKDKAIMRLREEEILKEIEGKN